MLDAAPRPWTYSDDSETMLSVAELLVRTGNIPATDLLSSMALEHQPKGPAHVRSLADVVFAVWSKRAGVR
jgi:hypothetical protein